MMGDDDDDVCHRHSLFRRKLQRTVHARARPYTTVAPTVQRGFRVLVSVWYHGTATEVGISAHGLSSLVLG